jgi:molecular chaperone IbpA
MTNYRAFGANDIHRLAHQAVGFDRFFDTLETLVTEKSTFPHHNIVKIGDNTYVVELAVAGFSEDEISIEMEKNVLNIKGVKLADDNRDYLHRGIANRSFNKTLTLVDTIEVKDATMENGMLLIHLENIIPEEKLPKKIPITFKGKKEFLKG